MQINTGIRAADLKSTPALEPGYTMDMLGGI